MTDGYRQLAIIALCIGVFGCGRGVQKPDEPLRLRQVTLTMEERANENWPARVELVRVGDMALVSEMLDMTVEDWFGPAGTAFRRANPQAYYDYWEVVPGSQIGPQRVRIMGRRLAGVLFCDTRAPLPPLRFERHRRAVIDVDVEGCAITGDGPGFRFSLGWLGL